MKLLVLIAILSTSLFAVSDLKNAPKDFVVGQSRYVFIDFTSAHYKILYQVDQKKAYVESTITFIQPRPGKAIFDFSGKEQASSYLSAKLHGQNPTPVRLVNIRNPHFRTAYRALNMNLPAGTYKISIKSEIEHLVKFDKGGVSSSFWMSDLEDRSFLEKYIPSNLDYDRFKMFFDVRVAGTTTPHKLITNCGRSALENGWFRVKCPSFFNTSSLYFHLFPSSAHKIYETAYKSISGKLIPLVTYGPAALTLQRDSLKILKELESDYGAWPHPHVIVFGWPPFSGGMEYSGATTTSVRALGHELHHSYFARGMFPAGGNAGWIDEALASWRDNGYPKKARRLSTTRMAGHSIYRRDTDRNAYGKGAEFIAHLNSLFAEKGGMKKFKKDLAAKFVYKPMTTPKFQRLLETYFQADLQNSFDKYIYGINRQQGIRLPIVRTIQDDIINTKRINHFHRPLTEAQMKKLL